MWGPFSCYREVKAGASERAETAASGSGVIGVFDEYKGIEEFTIEHEYAINIEFNCIENEVFVTLPFIISPSCLRSECWRGLPVPD
jgi:hypothetical protein